MITDIDANDNQMIDYTEFLSATISNQQFLTEQRLEAVFKQFDLDGNGSISADNLKSAMQRLGRKITDAEIQEIIKRYDQDGDNMIQFNEFKRMILDENA